MRIESLIKRKGGTKINMDAPERAYHFKPSDGEERHIAEVDVEHHAKRLLRIKEGYRAVDDVDFEEDPQDQEPTIVGSSVHAASYKILGGETIGLGDLVRMALDDAGLSVEDWNKLDDHERHTYIDTTLAELRGKDYKDAEPEQDNPEPTVETEAPKDANGNGINDALEGKTRAELVPLYVERFGREPSSRMKVEDIKRALSEDD